MTVTTPDLVAFRYSVKKYLYELTDVENIAVVFDRSLATPNLRNNTVDKWIVLVYGITRYANSYLTAELTINICTRQDPEWEKNCAVLEYIKGNLESAYYGGSAPIPFYIEGEQTGAINVSDIAVRNQYDLEDQTKITPMDINLWCPLTYIK